MYRRNYFSGAFFIFLLLLNPFIHAQTLTPEEIFNKVNKSVVVVLSLDGNGDIVSQGSGVVFDKTGLVATNFHIIDEGIELIIKHYDQIIEDVMIMGLDAQKDILILKIPENLLPAIEVAEVSKLQPGQRIYAIGSPFGFENTISEGIISGLRYTDELRREYIQITASISSGSSGGAIVNSNGDLIGISTATFTGGQNLNFAINISEFTGIELGKVTRNEVDFANLFSRGVKELESGNYANAIKIFSDYLKNNPSNAPAYFNRGIAKSELGDHRGAIQDFTKAIEIDPNYASAYYNRGCAKDDIGDYRGAIQDYTKAIEIDPNDADAYYNRGISKSKLEDYRGAIQDYIKAIEIDPNDASAYFNRGYSKNKLEDYRGAIQDYTKAIEIDPNYARAYYNRGHTKAEIGDYRGAIQDYTKAIVIDPNEARAYYNRGIAKYKLEDINGACLDWSKAGELGLMQAYDIIKEYCR